MLAVRSLTPQVRTQFTPIWVMPPVPLDPRTDVPTKTPERHVADVLTSLGDRWGMQPAFLDCHHLRWEQLANGANVFELAFQVASSAGLNVVAVLRDDSTDNEWGGYQRLSAARREEVALRISPLLWADLGSATGAARLEGLLARTGLPRSAVHLIVDVADQVTEPATISAAAVRGSLAEVESIEDWKTLTVLGTAMPATTAEVGRDNAAEIPRSEWAMWKLLQESRHRRPSFGDYAIQSTDVLSTFNPLFMQVSAQLRYTISNAWFVARGSSTRTQGFEQAHDLATQIVSHGEFAGRTFSSGDAWIADCASRTSGTGNATTWRTVTTNHHLTLVAAQLANLRGS
jgi:hypothetical protein